MIKRLTSLLLFVGLMASTSANAALINITYSVDFETHWSNEHYNWVGVGPSDYDSAALVQDYLNGTFFVTIQYNTHRTGEVDYDADGSIDRYLGLYSSIIATDIDMTQSEGHALSNFSSQTKQNKGQTTATFTAVNQLSMTIVADSVYDIIEGMDLQRVYLENEQPGEYDWVTSGGGVLTDTIAVDSYSGTGKVLSVTVVPEPGVLSLILVGLIAVFRKRLA